MRSILPYGHTAMGETDPLGHLASVSRFETATVAAIAGGNAKRLLGI